MKRSLRYVAAILTLVAGMALFFIGGVWYFMSVFYQLPWFSGLFSFLAGLGLIIISYLLKPPRFR